MSCCIYPDGIYLFKVNYKNTRTSCDICSKLTINNKDTRRTPLVISAVFIVNFEHISHFVLVILLLTFEHVIASWVSTCQI